MIGADVEFVQELNHQSRETTERPGNTDAGIDFDQDPSRRVDVDLQETSFIQR